MDPWHLASGLLGGLGLFLLGMSLLTDGLRLAAGPALASLLGRATASRLRALFAGIAITAVVQSSSAVTLATIGFVNAGLMSLAGALWVLFGANVGTSITGWIVALVGLRFKIEAYAFVLIGLGAILRLTAGRGPRMGLGLALAGFGLLFLGIEVLSQSFGGLATRIALPGGEGWREVLLLVLIGIAMTVLMQSSSAAIAVTLTAAQGGLLATPGAAAVVIGANVGTTVTALLGAIGATPDAKRAAAAHVLFNALTALVALALLPWLIDALERLRELLELENSPAAKLALFHTLFNVLGVLLIAPFAGRLAAFLEARFVAPAERLGRPRHLDHTLLAVPHLAISALVRELSRAQAIVAEVWRLRIEGSEHSAPLGAGERLLAEIQRFVGGLHRSAMSADDGVRLSILLRAHRYLDAALDLARELDERGLSLDGDVGALAEPLARTRARAASLIAALRPAAYSAETAEAEASAFEDDYQRFKSEVLAAAAQGALDFPRMDRLLGAASHLRRALSHLRKSARILAAEGAAESAAEVPAD